MRARSVAAFLAMALFSESALAHQPDGAATEIPASASSCAATATTLCLSANRFRVEVTWSVPPRGPSGVGNAVPLTGDSGYFWFFSRDNVELVIKIVDARSIASRFWVLYGALSNIEYTITVTDTVSGAIKTYFNPNGKLASVVDSNAFVELPVKAPPSPPNEEGASNFASRPAYMAGNKASPMDPATTCTISPTTLCLNRGRFQVQVAWLVPSRPWYGSLAGTSGAGNGVPLTDDTGYFWFFSKNDVELVIKILDGRTINDAYWFFVGALSNVEYVITVTDMLTGSTRTYWNAPEQLASIADTEAFGKARTVWRRLAASPNGKPVSALAVDPFTGDLYAPNGNAPDGGGVSRLPSGRSNWVPTSEPFSLGVSEVAIAPTEPPTIYAIANRPVPTHDYRDDTLFGSKDLGRTWTPLLHSAAAVVVDPSRPERVYAGGIPGELVYAIGVYKTENGGFSWAGSTGNFPCRALAISPSDPATIYAG
jgi:hypothetical protein